MQKRKSILVDARAEDKFEVPGDSQFYIEKDEVEFIKDDRLTELGNALIAERGCFHDLQSRKIVFLWKRQGGKTKGKVTLGKCQKPSGILAYFAASDFIIWVAADHARENQLTNWQMEALVFHELKHCDVDYDDKGELKLAINPHDLEAFVDEVRIYGAWKSDIERMAGAFQPTLFDTVKQFQSKLEEGDSFTIVNPKGRSATIKGAGRKTKKKITTVLNPL